ncbi:hypothetical protein M3936_14330 [Sutcliffiella horikoshii]|nr:hypothetical protein [Sutcliffiella horikoshii]MCM3618764.1 hypothetical protein [Sutcliffiella horikoshii]
MKFMTKELAEVLLTRRGVFLTSEGERLLKALVEEVTSSNGVPSNSKVS